MSLPILEMRLKVNIAYPKNKKKIKIIASGIESWLSVPGFGLKDCSGTTGRIEVGI